MRRELWSILGAQFLPMVLQSKHSKVAAASFAVAPAVVLTGARPWHLPRGTGLTGTQDVRAAGSSRLPLRFQRKPWEGR